MVMFDELLEWQASRPVEHARFAVCFGDVALFGRTPIELMIERNSKGRTL
jgi:hypothetical protein